VKSIDDEIDMLLGVSGWASWFGQGWEWWDWRWRAATKEAIRAKH
jgi:hypothetical protein